MSFEYPRFDRAEAAREQIRTEWLLVLGLAASLVINVLLVFGIWVWLS